METNTFWNVYYLLIFILTKILHHVFDVSNLMGWWWRLVELYPQRIFLGYVLMWDDCSGNMGYRTFSWLEHVNLTFSWILGPQIGHSMIWMESSLFRPSLINPMIWKEYLKLFIRLPYTMFVGQVWCPSKQCEVGDLGAIVTLP